MENAHRSYQRYRQKSDSVPLEQSTRTVIPVMLANPVDENRCGRLEVWKYCFSFLTVNVSDLLISHMDMAPSRVRREKRNIEILQLPTAIVNGVTYTVVLKGLVITLQSAPALHANLVTGSLNRTRDFCS